MKNDKDINSSLSEIKKVLTDSKEEKKGNTQKTDFYLLENVVKKGSLSNKPIKNKIEKSIAFSREEKKNIRKNSIIKKNKQKKEKKLNFKKIDNKNIPVENVINKEIKPIIRSWIQKNLRAFVKKVVLEEFKVISKAAFKQKSTSK